MSVVMSVDCPEPEGLVTRDVRFLPLTPESMKTLWEKLSVFPTLFNRRVATLEDFFTSFLTEGPNGVKANGLIWEVDDVGIIYITDIYPVFQATGHFTFWDGRFRGRELLILKMIEYVFETFGFQRIVSEVPYYTQPTMGAVERIGFVREGRQRKATLYKNEWWDVATYSMLRDESADFARNYDKLTVAQIESIRDRYQDQWSYKQLATGYGLAKAHIAFIVQSQDS